MSGRHRKPTTSSVSSVSIAKLAFTGAVIGGGSVGMAAHAHAATDSEWDTVAACESSGNWSINTGNGYQGGLQFSPSTWLGYGGGEFASAAHLASRDEQIAIAEKVLAVQGRGAWPVCGSGLSGPTSRAVTASPEEAPVVKAAASDAPATAAVPAAPLDGPSPVVPAAPQEGPAPAVLPNPDPVAPAAVPAPLGAPTPGSPLPAASAPEGAPVPAASAPGIQLPTPAAPAPAPPAPGGPAAAPVAPAPELLPPAPQPEIIAIGNSVPAAGATIIQASLLGPAPLAPGDPVPPILPTTPVPAPPAPPAPADPAGQPPAAAPVGAVPPAPAGVPTVLAAAPLPDGVPHLPSPSNPPPGTSTEPVGTSNPNVSYLKQLWQAVQNHQIDKNELLLALAQRSFTGPIPVDASAPAPGQAPATDPAPAPAS